MIDEENPQPIKGILRGNACDTRHVCWQCPECGHWWSDDYEEGDPKPLLSSCMNSQKHQNGVPVFVAVEWIYESNAS
ncbi:MAG: hypothetical protein JNJ77_04045 [Planctomycetia bacterium]|nr:hypothetical protein [Planctomycetia bacterium]